MSFGSLKKTMKSEKNYPPERKKDKLQDWESWCGHRESSESNHLTGLDLDSEYIKILEKKSTLPSNIRKMIKNLKHNNSIDFI